MSKEKEEKAKEKKEKRNELILQADCPSGTCHMSFTCGFGW